MSIFNDFDLTGCPDHLFYTIPLDVGCGTNHNLILHIPADQMNAQPDDAVQYVVFVQG